MASIFRSIFASKSTTGTPNQRVKGLSYDSAIALDPPVKGSYPVAGNGPNVLEEIQRSRAQRDTSGTRRQTGAAPAPSVPRYRDDIIARPRTAPNDGFANGGHNKRRSKSGSGSWAGRTRSGYRESESPPNIFRSSSQNGRRNSTRSTTELRTLSLPTPPLPAPKPQTYQPTQGPGSNSGIPAVFTPPYTQHNRTTSSASHRSYVDLLEAHSTIRPGTSKHRTKASGARNYGEDVADRNIDRFGAGSPSQLDLNSPQFSYMKTVYAPKKRLMAHVAGAGSPSRVPSALGIGHVMGDDGLGDDMASPSNGNSPPTTSRPPSPRNATTPVVAASTSRGREEDRSSSCKTPTPPSPSHDRRARAFSPLSQSNTAPSFDEDEQATMRDTIRRLIRPKSQSSSEARRQDNVVQPAAIPMPKPHSPSHEESKHLSNSPVNHTVKRMPAMPVSNEAPVHPPVNLKTVAHNQSTSGPVSYSTFPNTSNRPGNSQVDHTDYAVGSPTTHRTNKRQGMIVENSSTPPNLEGVVDLSNTVDTDVTTKTLSAVTHEHVTPVRHEIKEERIIREIHTHEVRHHILPVLDTQFLPTKHYVPSADGKSLIEIPESQVPGYKVTGSMNGTWSVSKKPFAPRSRTSSLTQIPLQPLSNLVDDESPEAPVGGLTRGEPKSRSRANSRASNHTLNPSRGLKNLFTEPILTSKREYMTEEGYPRTEYVWRHPPVFEDAIGRTQPVTIHAGFGEQNPSRGTFLEDSLRVTTLVRSPKDEEFLVLPDSGYGSPGMLPGLSSPAPTVDSMFTHEGAVTGESSKTIQKGKAVDIDTVGKAGMTSNAEGEATESSKPLHERRRGSAGRKPVGSGESRASQPHVGDLITSVNRLQV